MMINVPESKTDNLSIAQASHITSLRRFGTILSGLLVIAIVALIIAPSRLDIHVPPDISGGAVLSPGDVPLPNVYNFALIVWQNLNYWEVDGAEDGLTNIELYRGLITPSFKATLVNDHEKRISRGEARGRTRILRQVPSQGFTDKRVRKLSDGRWVVYLDMVLTERMGATETKRIGVRYPIVVEKYQIQPGLNPWGLALANFDGRPRSLILPGETK